MTNNSYGIYDGLVMSLAAALGQRGRAALQKLLLQRRQQYLTEGRQAEIAAGRYDFTLSCLSLALRDIAECEGDADAFIDTYQGRDLTNPRFASEIALQLLRSGRGQDALGYLDRATPSAENRHFGQTEWTDARIAVLDALQRVGEAQNLRLAFFQARLSPSHLRAYLDRLPDFDDVEAEIGRSILSLGTPMFMRRWLFWSGGRPLSGQPDWSACGSVTLTAIAMSYSIPLP